MTLMIASDLHGSAYYTQKLLDAFRREGADRLLLLGDFLENYMGEPPRRDIPDVDEQLNALADRIIAVRGNCDDEIDQQLLRFPMMADYVELEVNGLRLYATHGHLWNERFPPKLAEGEVLVHGHFHIPAWADHGMWYYVNPGSAARPRMGSERGYVMLRDRTFTWKTLDGESWMSHSPGESGPQSEE